MAVWTGGAWRAVLRGSGVVAVLAAPLALCRRWRGHAGGNPYLGFYQVAAATSVDVVPFLKAPMWLSSALLRAPGENPRSLDRAVAAFYVVIFLKTLSWS